MIRLKAQTEPLTGRPAWKALAFGKAEDEVKADGMPDCPVPHRIFEGNRPTNALIRCNRQLKKGRS
jgi:hypothetical protein